MDKKIVKLTENDLYKVIEQTVRKILNEDVNNSNNDFTEAMNALNQAYNLVAKARNLFLKSGMTANEDVTEMLNYFETTIQKISGEMQNIIYFNRQNEPIDY